MTGSNQHPHRGISQYLVDSFFLINSYLDLSLINITLLSTIDNLTT